MILGLVEIGSGWSGTDDIDTGICNRIGIGIRGSCYCLMGWISSIPTISINVAIAST